MAERIMYILPVSDGTIQHSLYPTSTASGSAYKLISEIDEDDNSTYILDQLAQASDSGAVTSNKTSTFNFSGDLTTDVKDAYITSVQLIERVTVTLANTLGGNCTYNTTISGQIGDCVVSTPQSSSTSTSWHTNTYDLDVTKFELNKSYTGTLSWNANCSNENTKGTATVKLTQLIIKVTYTADYDITNKICGTGAIEGANVISLNESADYLIHPLTTKNTHLSKLFDNGVDVTNQLIPFANAGTTFEAVSGATYGFAENSDGYYESQNKGKQNTAAVCQVNFNFPIETTVTFTFIQYNQTPTSDYGAIGKVDTNVGTTTTMTATNFAIRFNSSTYNKQTEQTYSMTVPVGEHYIQLKYLRARNSTEGTTYNDTLQFKWEVNMTKEEAEKYNTYSISDCVDDHSLKVIFNDYIEVWGKVNGEWKIIEKQYIKSDGTWIELSNDEKEDYFKESNKYEHIDL